MRNLFAFLFRDRRAPVVNRGKPGPSRRARERQKIIETAREMRFALGLPWAL